MEIPPNSPDYKSLSNEDLCKLCEEHNIYDRRRERSNNTMIKALKEYFRKAAGITMPVYALDYKRYSHNDLRKFCVQRGVLDQGSRQLVKNTYVSKLRAHDRKATFRFMDLPPELRLMVYSNLLRHQRSLEDGDGCPLVSKSYPQILRASKLCYREARDVLYEESSLSFRISGRFYLMQGDISLAPVDRDFRSFHALVRELGRFQGVRYVNVLLEDFTKCGNRYDPLYYKLDDPILQALASAFDEHRPLKRLTVRVFRTDNAIRRHESSRLQTIPAPTLAQMEDFKQGFRALQAVKRLPATTLVEFECLEKATAGMLQAILRENRASEV